MNIQSINNEIIFYGFRTPYHDAIEDLDRKMYFELERLESSFIDKASKERSSALDNFWKEKEDAELNIKKKFGLIKEKNFFQKLFSIK